MKTAQNAAIKPAIFLAFIPPAWVWLLILMFTGQDIFAAEQMDPNLVPSLFSSDLVPADSIARLAELVFVTATAIFTGMGGLFAGAVIFFHCQTKDDRGGSAQTYTPVLTSREVFTRESCPRSHSH
jgi:hypothetical protein